MPPQQIPTVIVGPNPLLRESLSRFLLGSRFSVKVLGSRLDELTCGTLPKDRSALAIVDTCDQPGRACEELRQFGRDHPMTRIVVLANHCASCDVVQVLNAGAVGYFATIATRDAFIKSLELVMEGQSILPSESLPWALGEDAKSLRDQSVHLESLPVEGTVQMQAQDVPPFSPRELFILRCLGQGSSNKVIARELGISEGTVKVHVKAILRKAKVKNRTQAAIWSLKNRALVPLDNDSPSGETPDGQSNIEVSRRGAGTPSSVPVLIADHAEQDAQGTRRKVRCIAGTQIIPQAG